MRPNKKNLRQIFVDKFKSKKTKKRVRESVEIHALVAKAAEVFSAKLMKRKQLATTFQYLGASTAMAFS